MKHHAKLGATLMLCAAAAVASAGCAIDTDDAEDDAGISGDQTALDESVGDAQQAIWGYARSARVGWGGLGWRGGGFAYRSGFVGGTRTFW